MSDDACEFRLHTVTPADPRFAFRVEAPADWAQMALPEGAADAPGEASFQPLAVFSARYGAVVFVFSVRPAFEEGTVAEWLGRLSLDGGIELTDFAPAEVGGMEAVGAMGTQASDMGAMTLRLAMFEQGGWAHSLTAMAPSAVWDSLAGTFDRMFSSFALADPQPATVVAWPAEEPWQEDEATLSATGQDVADVADGPDQVASDGFAGLFDDLSDLSPEPDAPENPSARE